MFALLSCALAGAVTRLFAFYGLRPPAVTGVVRVALVPAAVVVVIWILRFRRLCYDRAAVPPALAG